MTILHKGIWLSAIVSVCGFMDSAPADEPRRDVTEPMVIRLWPDRPPGETKRWPPEVDRTKPTDRLVAGRPVVRLSNVSVPQLHVYRPPEMRANGTVVLVCPGGGHRILAFDLEGTEVAQWLTRLGVTAAVLKYRVPFRDPDRRWRAAVQDAQRAMSVIRSRAREWSVSSNRIGVCGFSAGGETAALTAVFGNERQYAVQDDVDRHPCRPDFALLVYPARLVKKNGRQLQDYIRVSDRTPPMFLVHAFDDQVTPHNSLVLAAELKRAGVPVELHLFARGGHGYGLRQTTLPVTRWPELAERWLADRGLLP